MTNLSTTNPWHLTQQEIRVLEAFIAGGRSKSIAADLLVTQKTVEKHTFKNLEGLEAVEAAISRVRAKMEATA